MDIQEIKHQNLKRLCEERHIDGPAKLARILGVEVQHASQLLLGKVGIGPKTIKRLCTAWGIAGFLLPTVNLFLSHSIILLDKANIIFYTLPQMAGRSGTDQQSLERPHQGHDAGQHS